MNRLRVSVILLLVLLLAACATSQETLIAPERAHVRAKKSLVIATKVYDEAARTAAQLYATMPEGQQREAFKENVIRVGDLYLRAARAAQFALDAHQPTDIFSGYYTEAYNYLVMLLATVNAALQGGPNSHSWDRTRTPTEVIATSTP